MAFARKLFINWHTKERIRSQGNCGVDVADTLIFHKYETAPLQIMILEPNPTGGPNSFIIVDNTDLSLKVVINDTQDDSTPLVEQTSWTKNTAEGTFTGNLALNTAGMNAHVTEDREPYFEVEVTDSTGARVKVLSETCEVRMAVATVSTTAPDALQEYPTRAEMLGVCALRVMGPGETITWRDANGVNLRIFGVRTDGAPQDDAG